MCATNGFRPSRENRSVTSWVSPARHLQNQAQIDEYKAKGYAFMNGYDQAQPGTLSGLTKMATEV